MVQLEPKQIVGTVLELVRSAPPICCNNTQHAPFHWCKTFQWLFRSNDTLQGLKVFFWSQIRISPFFWNIGPFLEPSKPKPYFKTVNLVYLPRDPIGKLFGTSILLDTFQFANRISFFKCKYCI